MFKQPCVPHPENINTNFRTTVSIPQDSYIGNVSSQPKCSLTPFIIVSNRPCFLRNNYRCQISSLCNYRYILPVMTSDITAIASLLHLQSHIDSGRPKNYGVLITVWPQRKIHDSLYILLTDTSSTNIYIEGESTHVRQKGDT